MSLELHFGQHLKRKTKLNKVINSFWFKACLYDVFNYNEKLMGPPDKIAIGK